MTWLYLPKDKLALGDVAKLAVTLRQGKIPREFLDQGFDEVPLGTVGRVLMMAATELGITAPGDAGATRKFALARGTSQLCLAEIVAGTAGAAEARAHLDAVAAMVQQRAAPEGPGGHGAGPGSGPGKRVVGWLIAEHIDAAGREVLRAGGAVGSSTRE